MTNGQVDLAQHLFELSFALDSLSAEKNYVALRRTHYDNQKWIHDAGLMEEYYQFFTKRLQEEQE